MEGGGAAPKRSEDQALLALIKKATSIRRRSKSVGADGKRESAEMDEDEDNDKAYWTELKKMLRGGDEMLARQAFGFVVAQLRDRHSEVRKRALLLLGRLVKRSATLRTELARNIRNVLDLTVGSSRYKLSGSLEETEDLKATSLGFLEEWNETFGEQNIELRVAYRHLKDVVGASFPNRQAVQEQRARRLKAEAAERARSLAARYGAHHEVMRQGVQELRDVLGQMEACFDLIVPDMRKGLEALGEAPSAASSFSPATLGRAKGGYEKQAVGENYAEKENLEEDGEKAQFDDESVEWESGDDAEGDGEGLAAAGSRIEGDFISDNDSRDESDDERKEEEGLYGLGTLPFYEIEVDLPWLAGGRERDHYRETADLGPVFDQVGELYGVLTGRLLPQAEQWWRLLAACCVHYPETLVGEALESCRVLMKEMGTLKSQAWLVVEKCKEIGGAEKKGRDKKTKRKRGKERGGGGGGACVLPAATLELESFLKETDAAMTAKEKA